VTLLVVDLRPIVTPSGGDEVVPRFNEIEDRHASFGLGFEAFAVEQLAFARA